MCPDCVSWSCCGTACFRKMIRHARLLYIRLKTDLWWNLPSEADIASTSIDPAGLRSAKQAMASTEHKTAILYRQSLGTRRRATPLTSMQTDLPFDCSGEAGKDGSFLWLVLAAQPTATASLVARTNHGLGSAGKWQRRKSWRGGKAAFMMYST